MTVLNARLTAQLAAAALANPNPSRDPVDVCRMCVSWSNVIALESMVGLRKFAFVAPVLERDSAARHQICAFFETLGFAVTSESFCTPSGCPTDAMMKYTIIIPDVLFEETES